MEGHIVSTLVNTAKGQKLKTESKRRIDFPALALLVSGGHTELVLMKAPLKYKRIGETRDDAVGEAFDKVARMMDLPYPGGPKISRLAEETRGKKFTPKYLLPRPMIHSGDLDFSFSGLKTAVLYTIKKIPKLTQSDKKHIAREFEDAVVEVLVSKTQQALTKYKPKTFMIGGGVIANKEIRRALTELIQSEFPQTQILFPEMAMSTDNAVMIAAAGYMRALKSKSTFNQSKIKALKASGSLRL
jgi:N6-L-threonylcarbamoyladenine synthase